MKRLVLAALGALMVPLTAALAGPVTVSTDSERGRGIAAMRGDECMVVTPYHVVDEVSPLAEIDIAGPRAALGKAQLVGPVGGPKDDIALLRVVSNGAAVCAQSDDPLLKALTEPTLVARADSGALAMEPVTIRSVEPRTLTFNAAAESLRKMSSGSVVVHGGRITAMLVETPTGDEGLGVARNIEYISGFVGAWIRGASADVAKVGNALATLERAVKARPTTDIGQLAAVEQLVADGAAFGGMDLQGLALDAAALSRANFQEARLDGASLVGASLVDAKLTAAHFSFGVLRNVQAKGATATQARFYFTEADGANFEQLAGDQSNWTGAQLRTANFRGASLKGASFLLADLSAADFTGADLEGALFIGAVLDNARFDRARLGNTDFSGATASKDPFTPQQKAASCGTVANWVRVKLVSVVPSTRYRSGKDYSDLLETQIPLRNGLSELEPCALRTLRPAGKDVIYGESDEWVTESLDFHYPVELLDKGGRAAKFVDRIERQRKLFADRHERIPYITARGEQHRKLLEGMRRNVATVKPVGEAFLDFETLRLYALKYDARASDYDNEGVRVEEARRRVDRESSAVAGDGTQTKWAHLYPAGTRRAMINGDTARLFHEWTQGRARALPARAVVVGTSYPLDGDARNQAGRIDAVDPVSVRVLSASLGPHRLNWAAKDSAGTGDETFVVVGRQISSRHVIIIETEQPLDRYQVLIPRADLEEIERGVTRTETELDLSYRDTQAMGEQALVRVRAHPQRVRIVTSAGTVKTYAFAAQGAAR